MSDPLTQAVRQELAAPVPEPVRAFARHLAETRGARAVLFYGSNLRTGSLEGVLDFYLLTGAPRRRGWKGVVERTLWPDVSYHTWEFSGESLRAKAATLPLATFAEAAGGEGIDTTIWTRFVQPSALIWAEDHATATEVEEALAAAARTAARFAAALGPARGTAEDYWKALFRQTYAAELRVEAPGREDQILAYDPERYRQRLRLAWASDGVVFEDAAGQLAPRLTPQVRKGLLAAWARRRRWGKPVNAARLIKAAFTFEGAAQYAAWKIERHTGVPVPMTPFRERHPILAAPGVLWRTRRSRRPKPERPKP